MSRSENIFMFFLVLVISLIIIITSSLLVLINENRKLKKINKLKFELLKIKLKNRIYENGIDYDEYRESNRIIGDEIMGYRIVAEFFCDNCGESVSKIEGNKNDIKFAINASEQTDRINLCGSCGSVLSDSEKEINIDYILNSVSKEYKGVFVKASKAADDAFKKL